MLQPVLEAVIPKGKGIDPPGRVAQAAWTVWLLLFPVALVGGYFLIRNTEPKPPISVAIDGPKAIAIARAFAKTQGIPIEAWTASYGYGMNNTLLAFVNSKAERRVLWKVAPPMYGVVTMSNRALKQSGKISISLEGRVFGYEWKNLPRSNKVLSDDQALKLVESQLPTAMKFRQPSVDKKTDQKNTERKYTFHSMKYGDMDVTVRATVQGDRITSLQADAEPDLAAASDRKYLQMFLAIVGVIYCFFVALYSVFRYAARSSQQEVSHSRSITVAILCVGFCIVIAFNAAINGEIQALPAMAIIAVFSTMGLLGGVVLAAAYGSGEGELREAYPGKLTSLDALLTGRIFTRNVGVSLLFGMASASWLVFVLGVTVALFRENTIRASETMVGHLMRAAWIAPFFMYPPLALSFAAAGLLQPLAFLHRYFNSKPRWHLPVLVVCGGLVASLRNTSSSNWEFLVFTSVLVLALLIPFFYCDLLATLACVTGVFATVSMANASAALPPPHNDLHIHMVAATATAFFAIICIRRGNTVTEEQVRPVYARHIAERKALEAEISAAREAQLRLLPQSVPDVAGLGIVAACVPAETVGGDFYDFLPLGDGRLGIFIAEGNSRGLAAALTIALAKGYLMHCVEKYRDPVDVLSRLEMALATMFNESGFDESGTSMTDFAFASIDIRSGAMRYARTGAYPKVVVSSASGNCVVERLVPVKGRSEPIVEGTAALQPGDRVLLFTDGVGRRIAAAANCKAEEAAGRLSAKECRDLAELQDRFLANVNLSLDPDDLTLVVVEVQAADATALWGAA